MAKLLEFDAVLQGHGDGGYSIVVPFDVEAVFGTKAQVRVRGTIDGHPYRLALAPMGGGKHHMGIRREIREAIGKPDGGLIHVTMELDTDPRVVDVPEDFQAALNANADAGALFAALAYSHRKAYVDWITEAKKPETRARRIDKAIAMIREQKKQPR